LLQSGNDIALVKFRFSVPTMYKPCCGEDGPGSFDSTGDANSSSTSPYLTPTVVGTFAFFFDNCNVSNEPGLSALPHTEGEGEFRAVEE
jgi:hypothetical protein